MLCKIADLYVEVPDTGNMAQRCQNYLTSDKVAADIVIDAANYRIDAWEKLSVEDAIYLESGFAFYVRLLLSDGLMLHSSALEYEGKAYLFSGPSGMGKSTHTRLWKSVFGDKVHIFNDDKPALRCIDGKWYAYGTPWCGKDAININMKAPIAGICFLRRGTENKIRRLSAFEAASAIISQTMSKFSNKVGLELMIKRVNDLVAQIPVYELENLPEPAAAELSHKTMSEGAVN